MTTKQKIFIEAYLANGYNGSRAALKAGYSEKTAREIARENLTKPDIKEEIQNRVTEELKSIGVNTKAVIEQVANLAFSDIRKLFDKNGNFKSIEKIDKRTAVAISGIKFTTKRSKQGEYEDVTDIRFSDKKGALETLCKHLGLFHDKNQIDPEENKINITVSLLSVENLNQPDCGNRPEQ